MSRSFAYARVSTADQATDNQVLEIQTTGFAVEPHRIIVENISGIGRRRRAPRVRQAAAQAGGG